MCKAKYYYSDVLGKHSEVDVSIDKVCWELCEDDCERKERHDLNFEEPRTAYDNRTPDVIHDKLCKYMRKLPKLYPNEFLNGRYDELVKYTHTLLEDECKSNDPPMILTATIPKWDSYRRDDMETVKLQLPLSKLLTLLAVKAQMYIKYSWEINIGTHWPEGTEMRHIYNIDIMTMKPDGTNNQYVHGAIKTYWDKNTDNCNEVHNRVVEILADYPRDGPIAFCDKYLAELKGKCATICT